jgi:selenocysteine-specific elongation factor
MVEKLSALSLIERLDNQASTEVTPGKTLNINVGVLGHIDSGKTSLCKALSTIASTAGFDKNPQSKERGITLDLGFSAFVIRIPDWFRHVHTSDLEGFDFIQFTLVDCPGHASLMKTIIGGASIIDLMLLVVDAQKLIQTQTAECIVLGELLMDKLIVALNKVDLFPTGERAKMIE